MVRPIDGSSFIPGLAGHAGVARCRPITRTTPLPTRSTRRWVRPRRTRCSPVDYDRSRMCCAAAGSGESPPHSLSNFPTRIIPLPEILATPTMGNYLLCATPGYGEVAPMIAIGRHLGDRGTPCPDADRRPIRGRRPAGRNGTRPPATGGGLRRPERGGDIASAREPDRGTCIALRE